MKRHELCVIRKQIGVLSFTLIELLVVVAVLGGIIAAEAAEAALKWDFREAQPQWNEVRGMTVSREKEGLRLTVNAYDSSLGNANVNIDPAKYGRVKIVYHADSLPKGGITGEFFFAGEKHPSLRGTSYANIPALSDAKGWQTMVLELDKLEAWSADGRIVCLRLDMLNQFPASILLKSVEMLPRGLAKLYSLNDVVIKDGWLLHHDGFKGGLSEVGIPAGKYNVWARCTPGSPLETRALTVTGGKWSPERPERHGVWLRVGALECAGGTVSFKLPEEEDYDFSSLLVTSDTSVPADRKCELPTKIEPDLKGKEDETLWNRGLFDKYKSSWGGKMVNVKGQKESVGISGIRREFRARELPKEALLQVVADDGVKGVLIDGREVKPEKAWTENWKEASVVDVTKFIKPGANVLAILYENTGNVGGLMFDLALSYGDGDVEHIMSDAACRGVFGVTGAGAWSEPGDGGAGLLEVEVVAGPPAEPWLVSVPFVSRDKMAGSVNVISLEAVDPRVESVRLRMKLKAKPALQDDEAAYAYLYDKKGNMIAIRSDLTGNLSPQQKADGTVELDFSDFNIPEFGEALDGYFECGIHKRTLSGRTRLSYTLPVRKVSGGPESVREVRIQKDGRGNRILMNGKPFYPFFLSIFYERGPTGLEGPDSPVRIREFPCGGLANTWWKEDDTFDFTEINQRFLKAIHEYPNAYIALWVWCEPPLWYATKYPDRISRNFDGSYFRYYTATTTFSDAGYHEDMGRALSALVNYCEKNYGGRVIAYNLCGGVSFEWQGWGCHELDAKATLADYSPSATRDYLAFLKREHPEIKISRIPTYEERFSSDGLIFRNPVKDAAAIAYDEYYANAISDCIAYMAAVVKRACNRKKLVGCYYGYLFEYMNMSYCINSSGHSGVGRLLVNPDIDFLLSPPSYGIREIGNSGGEMKAFGSIMAHGKLSILEDDTRTNETVYQGLHQTLTDWQSRMVLRRNYGMALSRRTPVCHLPIVGGNDMGSSASRSDLARVVKAGQMAYDLDLPYRPEVAFVVDESSRKYLEPTKMYAGSARNTYNSYSAAGVLTYREPRSVLKLTGELVYYQRVAMSRFGAPSDWILLSDVEALAANYKLFVFLDVFAESAQARRAMEAVRARNATVLVAYGYGFVGSKGIDADAMSRLLGMNIKRTVAGPLMLSVRELGALSSVDDPIFGTESVMEPRFAVADSKARVLGRYLDNGEAALAVKRVGGSETYYCGVNVLPSWLLADVARAAGVHLYTAAGDTLYAGCGSITVHAAQGGMKHISLREKCDVVDLYSLEVLARGVSAFDVKLTAHETRTFALGDASEILKRLK